jgi:vrille
LMGKGANRFSPIFISDVLKQRMMVAEFVARQHSSSPVNGETPNQNHTNSNMPGHSALLLSNSGNITGGGPGNFSNSNNTTNISMNGNTNGNNGSMSAMELQMMDDRSSPTSSCGQYDENGSPYDLAAHLKRKELFSQRKQREFIPDNKKDDSYWDRRRRNNEAAKRSREKRRFNDMVLEQRVVELTKENHVLKAQLDAIKDKYNICGENLVSVDQILATLPTSEQVLSITKRAKISTPNNGPNSMIYANDSPSPSPMPTSVIHQNVTNGPAAGAASVQNQQSSSPPSSLHTSTNGQTSVHSHNFRRHTRSPAGGHNEMSNDGSENENAPPPASILHNFHSHLHHQQNAPAGLGAMNPNTQLSANHLHGQLSGAGSNVHLINRLSPPNHLSNHFSLGPHPPHSVTLNHQFVPAQYSPPSTTAAAPAVANGLVPSSSSALNGTNNMRRTPPPSSHHHHQLQNLHAATHLHQHHTLQHSHHHLLAAVAAAKHVNASGALHDTHNDDLPPSPPNLSNSTTNVLNLSRRGGAHIARNTNAIAARPGAASPYEVSSGTGSGEDEHLDCENSGSVADQHNSLPLKLRHKSHLGDKDAAATALLALHSIKQEPNLRESPPWDGEGSSDERDSGISSLGTTDWTSLQTLQATRKIVVAAAAAAVTLEDNLPNHASTALVQGTSHLDKDEENIHLKSQLARLESEVATIKNMMILNTNGGSGTAAAQ